MVLKNSFIPVERIKDAEGKLYRDQDAAFYMTDAKHEALAGKEFCNTQEALQAIIDYNNKNPKEPFSGELILLNVFTIE